VAVLLLATAAAAVAAEPPSPKPDFESRHYRAAVSRTTPAFTHMCVDSLGAARFPLNPVIPDATPAQGLAARVDGNAVAYVTAAGATAWEVAFAERSITLRSRHADGERGVPFTLTFDQTRNHATLLGRMEPGKRDVALPCVLHLPDLGTFRVTASARGAALDYDARRWNVKPPFVRIAFPPATAAQGTVEYAMEVVALHPPLAGIEGDARFDAFRRNFLI